VNLATYAPGIFSMNAKHGTRAIIDAISADYWTPPIQRSPAVPTYHLLHRLACHQSAGHGQHHPAIPGVHPNKPNVMIAAFRRKSSSQARSSFVGIPVNALVPARATAPPCRLQCMAAVTSNTSRLQFRLRAAMARFKCRSRVYPQEPPKRVRDVFKWFHSNDHSGTGLQVPQNLQRRCESGFCR